MNTKELFDTIVAKRGAQCEMCYGNLGTELHHCIVRRSKKHPEYDAEENLMLLCRRCHSDGYVNSYQCKVGFWSRQVERGYNMRSWYDSLGLKVKENF